MKGLHIVRPLFLHYILPEFTSELKNKPSYFFIITDLIIFITDNTLLYNIINHKYLL